MLDIVVQVGRTGVLTPKVIVGVGQTCRPQSLVTSHNQDNIDRLDVRIGDTVLLQKAGEIIPEVLSVNKSKRPDNTVPFTLPAVCPECGSPVVRDEDGAAPLHELGVSCSEASQYRTFCLPRGHGH